VTELASGGGTFVESCDPSTPSTIQDGAEARRQLGELERVVEFLEQLNLLDRTLVPPSVIAILTAMGLEATVGLVPTTLLPRILDRQRLLRRRLAIARR